MLFIGFAVSSGIYVLFQTSGRPEASTDAHSSCVPYRETQGRFQDWHAIAFALLNEALEGNSITACLIETMPDHWVLAWAYGFLFFTLSVVLVREYQELVV
jgi:hypothetical protein